MKRNIRIWGLISILFISLLLTGGTQVAASHQQNSQAGITFFMEDPPNVKKQNGLPALDKKKLKKLPQTNETNEKLKMIFSGLFLVSLTLLIYIYRRREKN